MVLVAPRAIDTWVYARGVHAAATEGHTTGPLPWCLRCEPPPFS